MSIYPYVKLIFAKSWCFYKKMLTWAKFQELKLQKDITIPDFKAKRSLYWKRGERVLCDSLFSLIYLEKTRLNKFGWENYVNYLTLPFDMPLCTSYACAFIYFRTLSTSIRLHSPFSYNWSLFNFNLYFLQ